MAQATDYENDDYMSLADGANTSHFDTQRVVPEYECASATCHPQHSRKEIRKHWDDH